MMVVMKAHACISTVKASTCLQTLRLRSHIR